MSSSAASDRLGLRSARWRSARRHAARWRPARRPTAGPRGYVLPALLLLLGAPAAYSATDIGFYFAFGTCG